MFRIYRSIRVPAVRSDVARLVLLHRFGGFYVDIAMAFHTGLTSLIGPETELFLVRRDDAAPYRDRPETAHLVNGIVGAKAGSWFVLECLRRAYLDLDTGYRNYSASIVSGPQLLTEVWFAHRRAEIEGCEIANFSELAARHFTYMRTPGVNNSWVGTQRDGLREPEVLPSRGPHHAHWEAAVAGARRTGGLNAKRAAWRRPFDLFRR